MLVGEAVLLTAYVTAWVLARKHRGRHHHFVMLSSFALDMLVFKPLMLSRAIGTYGSYPWPGTNIAIHFWFDVLVAILGVLTIYLAFRFRVKKNKKMFMPPKGRIHRTAGYAFIVLWVSTFVLGIWLFSWAHIH
jgi:uncharacterized membrane protein YozB (DUF420 family)